MIWLSVGIEVCLIGFVIVEWILSQKKQKPEWSSEQKEDRIIRILWPAGGRLARILAGSDKKREKNQIYQILNQLTAEGEGEILFQRYQQKRWSMILGVLILFFALWSGQQIFSSQEEGLIDIVQERPAYGEGDEKEKVIAVLEGETPVQSALSIQIPEQAISEGAAEEKLQQGMKYIRTFFSQIKVSGDITFPMKWEEVSFSYDSLTPELIGSDGNWIGEITQEPQNVILQVTGSIAGKRETEIVCLQTKALSELDAEQRLQMIVDQVQDGKFLSEDTLALPTETGLGEKIQWKRQQDSSEVVWISLGVMLLVFCLWRQDREYKQLMKDRQQKIQHVYPEFINELVILVGAGLSLPAAWKRIGQDYQRKRQEGYEINPLYEEVYRESKELESGSSMREVLEEFTVQIRFKEARRFAILLVQNLKRGDAFLISRLKELNQEAWEIRKKQVRAKSEEADTKLLIPLMLMLVVILIIVLAPAMITMQV